jgi:hypothetical protein
VPQERRFLCFYTSFPTTLFDEPQNAERGADPGAAALRARIADPAPAYDYLVPSGYWLASDPAEGAFREFIARAPEGAERPFVAATFEQIEGGSFTYMGGGPCHPHLDTAGEALATWVLADGMSPPGPATTQIIALVSEIGCLAGEPDADRLLPPSILYTDDAVTVTFTFTEAAGSWGCDETPDPPERVTFELREPLGDRVLLDGSYFPALDPTAPGR